jgi:hypothetical protein
MSTLEPATAEVETWPDGSVGVLVTIPAAKGPVRLTLSVSRHEETGEWQASLPLWLEEEDLVKLNIEGVAICYTSRTFDDDDIIEPDLADPESYDSWEVILGGRTTLIG